MNLDFQQIATQLGIAVVFVYLYFRQNQQYVELLMRKDKDLADINSKLVVLVENNTKALTELKEIISDYVRPIKNH